jgi:hypothetical protein
LKKYRSGGLVLQFGHWQLSADNSILPNVSRKWRRDSGFAYLSMNFLKLAADDDSQGCLLADDWFKSIGWGNWRVGATTGNSLVDWTVG